MESTIINNSIEYSKSIFCLSSIEFNTYNCGKWILSSYIYESEHDKNTIPSITNVLIKSINNIKNKKSPIILRIHSECRRLEQSQTSVCNCGYQLIDAMTFINIVGCGIIVFPTYKNFTHIDIFNHVKRYNTNKYITPSSLQFCNNNHNYEIIKLILDDLNISKINLLTNNQYNLSELSELSELSSYIQKFTSFI
jgi:3,4-dihydroxy 2-butanone 4-phosphate synthase / GTP cyclohydrolase II